MTMKRNLKIRMLRMNKLKKLKKQLLMDKKLLKESKIRKMLPKL